MQLGPFGLLMRAGECVAAGVPWHTVPNSGA